MMKRIFLVIAGIVLFTGMNAQDVMTPELLWKLGRVGALGITDDENSIVYSVSTFDAEKNASSRSQYIIPINGGEAIEIENGSALVADRHISPANTHRTSIQDVKLQKVFGNDFYPELDKSNVMVYNDLMYRHWDTWEDGQFSHIFLHKGNEAKGIDIMEGEPFDCPTTPFGGEEDYTWSADGKNIVYVTKKKSGRDYAVSTNTDLYEYNIETGKTTNLTEGMLGYDINPVYSSNGALAWLSMARDGYEADKNDIIVKEGNIQVNLTKDWDGTVNSMLWKKDGWH